MSDLDPRAGDGNATPLPSPLLRIPPPIWGVLSVVVAVGLDRLFDWSALGTFQSRAVAVVFIAAGVALAVWGRLTFARAGTEIIPTSPANKVLVTHGPFRYVRNPMYLGVMALSLGIALLAGSPPFYLTTVLLFLLLNFMFIPFEEAKMERQYGRQFLDYKARARRWGVL